MKIGDLLMKREGVPALQLMRMATVLSLLIEMLLIQKNLPGHKICATGGEKTPLLDPDCHAHNNHLLD
ncbi:hypothetical protein G9A89_016157 [Geosiphon pyriformis]|nr:hypothetical protein G9A89_016157 [Geosiphon pyriformis]